MRLNGPLCLLTLVVAAFVALSLPNAMVWWEADYFTAAGAQERVALPDGSVAWLNTESAISVDYHDGKRAVRLLRGEAFFDVIHDEAHPFTVAAAYSRITDKGTAFAVRRDSDHDEIELERGRVEVARLSDTADVAVLHPGQMVLASDSSLSSVRTINAGQAFAWLHGRVIFSDERFSEAVNELNRYYGGRVLLLDHEKGRIVVSGSYLLSDPLGAMRSLAAVVRAKMYTLPGGVVVFR